MNDEKEKITRQLILVKIQDAVNNENKYGRNEELSKYEYNILLKMIEENKNLKLGSNYITDKVRNEYPSDSYYYEAEPEEKAEIDSRNGNDYLSICFGDRKFLNLNYDRYRETAKLCLEDSALLGDSEYSTYDEFEMESFVTLDELIKGMNVAEIRFTNNMDLDEEIEYTEDKVEALKSKLELLKRIKSSKENGHQYIDLQSEHEDKRKNEISIDEMKKEIENNDNTIANNEEEIKQELVKRLLEQQKRIAEQEEKINRLKNQKEL